MPLFYLIFIKMAIFADIADFIGDSLALAQWAAKTTADIVCSCVSSFYGRNGKIIEPKKTVFIPDAKAGYSLADSCQLKNFNSLSMNIPIIRLFHI